MQTKSASMLIAAVLALLPIRLAAGQCGSDWLPGTGCPGPDTQVMATITWDDGQGPALYLAGYFKLAGDVIANHVARWDGAGFQSLGLGLEGSAFALTVYDNDLLVAGQFSTAGGKPAQSIARWDGTTWHPLGDGLSGGPVTVVHGHGSSLFASGDFTQAGGQPAPHMAQWDGANWSPVNSWPLLVPATAMTSYAGQLVAAAGPGGLWAWDGSSWATLGVLDTGGSVDSLYVFEGDLIVGGSFSTISGVPADKVARWNGTAWSALGSPYESSVTVNLLASLNGTLVASDYGGSGVKKFRRWTGGAWETLATLMGESNWVATAAPFSGSLYVCGDFISFAGVSALNAVRWDGSAWAALLPAPTVILGGSDLAVHNGEVYTPGTVSTPPPGGSSRLLHSAGAGWLPLPGAITGRSVSTLLSTASGLFAGGNFQAIDGITMNGIARWDGTAWSSLGIGVCCSSSVLALAEFGGDVVVGGNFTFAGPASAKRVARWNGAAWSSLGGGFDDGQVHALVVHQGMLIAAGSFTRSGSTTLDRIAAWNGSAWSPMDQGFRSSVYALHVYAGELYAAGAFVSTGAGMPVERIARWSGSAWLPVGGGANNAVRELAPHDGELVALGDFTMAGGVAANHIARWNGSRWAGFGAGLGGHAASSGIHAVDFQNELWVSGDFDTAGWRASLDFARWAPSGPAIVSPPQSQGACMGGSVSLTVSAPGATAFQWRRAFSPLLDFGNITGATTSTLTISPLGPGDAASDYNCLVSGPGCLGSGSSEPAAVLVLDATGDGNANGKVNAEDIQGMVDALVSATPTPTAACTYDLDNDGQITPADVSLLVSRLLAP